MKYSIYAVRIFTQRWQESFRFYKDVLELPVFFQDSEVGWAQFDVDGCLSGSRKVRARGY